MWHQQDFGLDRLGGGSDGDGDSFARAARVQRERPSRPGTSGTETSPNQYISGDPNVSDTSEYNIQINFQGTWSADLRQAFITAADAISDFILGDIPSSGARRSAVDDLAITASLISIDGAGGILGQAGPDAVRAGSFLPSRGTMEFDSADAAVYQAAGLFDDIVLHEMLHTIGFGTIWSDLGLISGGFFNGARANAEYLGAGLIPLELDGGSGTAYAH